VSGDGLPVVYAALDAKVAPLVLALRADGYPTTHSCDGDVVGAAYGLPWVTLVVDEEGYAQQVIDLLEWLDARGISASVSLEMATAGGEWSKQIRVLVYSDLSEARL
jgi:hypothetical protein